MEITQDGFCSVVVFCSACGWKVFVHNVEGPDAAVTRAAEKFPHMLTCLGKINTKIGVDRRYPPNQAQGDL